MTPEQRAEMERLLVPHFGIGVTADGIGWLVGIVARLEECERRLTELERGDPPEASQQEPPHA